jgi:branched-chain amino acid transport system ATP-binding protein
VESVSLSVQPQEILAIIGPNGAGKTTVFNLIAGAFRPSSGSVTFDGHDVTRLPPYRRLRMGIARTFQLIRPFPSLTILENVMVSATGSGMTVPQARARAGEVIESLGLSRIAGKLGSNVNAVEGKRLEVARALATRPRVILLDEIFSGLNHDEVGELAAIVRALPKDGLTVLFIEHNVGAIRSVADRVLAMEAGRVVCQGEPEEVLTDPQVVEMYLGSRSRA